MADDDDANKSSSVDAGPCLLMSFQDGKSFEIPERDLVSTIFKLVNQYLSKIVVNYILFTFVNHCRVRLITCLCRWATEDK